MRFACLLPFAAVLSLQPAVAQTVTIRDTFQPLLPISVCIDAATHITAGTNQRLVPIVPIDGFVGQAVEMTGTFGTSLCPTFLVSSIQPIPSTTTANAQHDGVTITYEFFGDGPAGDGFFVFVALERVIAGPVIPGLGPFHLDPLHTLEVGAYAPLGPTTPMLTLTTSFDPVLAGRSYHVQSVAFHAAGGIELTNVHSFWL